MLVLTDGSHLNVPSFLSPPLRHELLTESHEEKTVVRREIIYQERPFIISNTVTVIAHLDVLPGGL